MMRKIKKVTDIKLPNIAIPKQLNIPINPKLIGEVLFYKDKRVGIFLELSLNKRIELLRSLTNNVKKDILLHVPEADIAELLQTIDPDEATDILQLMTKSKREKVLLLVSQGLRDSISTLLEFDAKTAAGLMTLDYIQVSDKDNITTVAKKFKLHEKRTGRPPVILVVNDDHKLIGYLPGHELGFARKTDIIDKYVKRMITISYAATHDEVMDKFVSHPHSKIAVMNDSNQVMGIIYSDDILRLIQESESSSLYDFAGISDEESVSDPARAKVRNRYRWLIINLGTAFMASFVVSQFEDTLATYVILAAYMPIVAGMGGNAATQTLAVLVRGISLRQIELKTGWKTLRNEMVAGLTNGLVIGILVATIVFVTTRDIRIALVLGMAMIINLCVAALFGTIVPLVMARLGKDPATSATIFITAGTDILGFMVFLGLATAVLS